MSYIWDLPTKVLFGPGSIKKLGKQKLPGRKALILTSNGTSAKRNGSLDAVVKTLDMAGIPFVLFDRIPANPTEPLVMDGVAFCRQNGCDFVIGIGGGSVLDSATVIAAVAPQKDGRRVWDYLQRGTGGRHPLLETSLPCIEITTTAGTGSEVDCWGVITNPETHEKIALQGAYPELAIVDPELMLGVPASFTAYQGFDALFHSVEGYLSKKCNEAAAMVELEAIRNVALYLPRAVRDGSDLEARTKIAFANTLSGYSMGLCSCISEHAMEHAMSGFHGNLPHGAGLLMICIEYFTQWVNQHVCDERFLTMAAAMGVMNPDDPMQFVEALRVLMEDCGVSELKMSEYGIVPAEFPVMAQTAKATMWNTFLCDRFEMSDADVIGIFERSWR